jgi:peptide/nickel transport system permease protein
MRSTASSIPASGSSASQRLEPGPPPRGDGGAAPWARRPRGLAASPAFLIGGALAFLLVGAAVFAPLLAPGDPLDADIQFRLHRPSWTPEAGRRFPLGADAQGRDVLSRILYGGQVSLFIGLASVAISGVVGVGLGLLSGYLGGWWDDVIMRVADVQLAFPFVLLAMAVVAALGSSIPNLIAVFSLTGWVASTRLVRGQVLTIRELAYVEAARALGHHPALVMLRHVLPNVVSPILVLASFELARIIILESALSFLGLGVQAPTPSWGNMLGEGREYMRTAWWLSVFPGCAIVLAVLGVNLLGDGLRDLLDPKARRLGRLW